MTDQHDLFGAEPPEPPIEQRESVPREVYELFESFALQLYARGISRYSSDAILHRIRWHYHVERGNREFACNDNWTSHLARWFMRKHPELGEFFETRRLRASHAEDLDETAPDA
jgi:hypothetical protein